MKLRASNHRLNCETGRYLQSKRSTNFQSAKDSTLWRKSCHVCCADEAEALSYLPFYQPILEDEQHVLAECPKYHHLRHQLDDNIKSIIMRWDPQELPDLFAKENIVAFSKYLRKVFGARFPKNESTETLDQTQDNEEHTI